LTNFLAPEAGHDRNVLGRKGRFCHPRPKAWEGRHPASCFGLKGRFGQVASERPLQGRRRLPPLFPRSQAFGLG
jgi:hypothetical protein